MGRNRGLWGSATFAFGGPTTITHQQKDLMHRIRSFCWWGMVDSDHRSETQQIYSLPPLATREIPRMELVNGVEPSTC